MILIFLPLYFPDGRLVFAASAIPIWFLVSPLVQGMAPVLFEIGETLAFAGVPVAVGIAVLKYRLYDIDLVINRTLVYGALTAIVVGIYVFVVGYLGALFRTEDLLVSLIATGVVAVLFAPLRNRLQGIVNRLLYGERDDPYAALSRLGQRLEATLTPDAVLSTAVKAVAEALKAPYAAIEFERDGIFGTVATTGEPAEEPLRLPLVYGGETVGRLVLGRRYGEEDFSSADRRILHTSPHISVLVISMYEDDDSVFAAFKAGARGYLLKGALKAEILRSIRAVSSGEAIFGPAIARRLMQYFSSPHPAAPQDAFPELTEREHEILELIARHETNPEIAKRLHLSPKTVRNHVSNIFTKLQVADRAQAIIRAREAGLGREGGR
jgi:DNA-binding NarL/FixJ family response regulator